MARAKKSNILSDFWRDSKPDAERLAELVNRARGKRSVTEFARLCGVSPSTISRLGRAQNNTPSSDDLIVEIAINADKDSGVSFQDLVNAHGMHLIREEYYDPDDVAARYEEAFDRIVADVEFNDSRSHSQQTLNRLIHCAPGFDVERRVREIISNDLMDLGYSVALEMEQVRSNSAFFDFVLMTNALRREGLSSWGIEVKAVSKPAYNNYIDKMFSYAYTNNPRREGQRITVAFIDYDTYKQAKSRVRDICVEDSISLMYVDLYKSHVVAEYVLQSNNCRDVVRLFREEDDRYGYEYE